MSGECPRGGGHAWRKTMEKNGWITHTCSKCREGITRRQGGIKLAVTAEDIARERRAALHPNHGGRVPGATAGRSAGDVVTWRDVACKAAAVLILAAAIAPIWLAAEVHP